MTDESPPPSPLSELSSDAFEGDESPQRNPPPAMRPSKRPKLGDYSMEPSTPPRFQDVDNASISTDTDGEVPYTPSNPRPEDDDAHEQVTACNWEGCTAGDQGNMDKLVVHIHNEHVEGRGKKYTCEWSDCVRKSFPHASAYALKAHMRSHTKEKPFFCELPGKPFALNFSSSAYKKQNATAPSPGPTPSKNTTAPSTKQKPSAPQTLSRNQCKPKDPK